MSLVRRIAESENFIQVTKERFWSFVMTLTVNVRPSIVGKSWNEEACDYPTDWQTNEGTIIATSLGSDYRIREDWLSR